LEEAGFRVEVDDRNERLSYRIRDAETQKVPYIGDLGAMKVEELIERMRREIDD